jgi:hypothetical protein
MRIDYASRKEEDDNNLHELFQKVLDAGFRDEEEIKESERERTVLLYRLLF